MWTRWTTSATSMGKVEAMAPKEIEMEDMPAGSAPAAAAASANP